MRYVDDVLTEHKHKLKKKAYAYAYVAAALSFFCLYMFTLMLASQVRTGRSITFKPSSSISYHDVDPFKEARKGFSLHARAQSTPRCTRQLNESK